jgi:hypothetical protein
MVDRRSFWISQQQHSFTENIPSSQLDKGNPATIDLRLVTLYPEVGRWRHDRVASMKKDTENKINGDTLPQEKDTG